MEKLLLKFQLAFLTASLLFTVNIQAQNDTAVSMDLKEYFIYKNPEFETFVRALNQSKLIDNLQVTGPYTFFIPLNVAFTNLPYGNIDTLLEPQHQDSLQKLITKHIIAGEYPLLKLERSIKENGGEYVIQNIGNHNTMTFKIESNRIYIETKEGIKIFIGEPERYQNGLIYSIEKVIIPSE